MFKCCGGNGFCTTIGDWNEIGLQDFGDSNDWAYYYESFDDYFYAAAKNAKGHEVQKTQFFDGSYEWTCDDVFFKHKVPGDDQTPSTV